MKKSRLIAIDEYVLLMGEKSKQAVYNKHNRNKLPIRTYKINNSLRWKLNEALDYIENLEPTN